MTKYKEQFRRGYPKVLLSVLVFSIFGTLILSRSKKSKDEFYHLNGTVVHLSSVHPLGIKKAENPNTTYLVLEDYERVFSLFVGRANGDFSREVNRLESIVLGDRIDLYYDDNYQTKNEITNKLVQYIYKGADLLYLRSETDKYLAYLVLGAAGIFLFLGIYMKLNAT